MSDVLYCQHGDYFVCFVFADDKHNADNNAIRERLIRYILLDVRGWCAFRWLKLIAEKTELARF